MTSSGFPAPSSTSDNLLLERGATGPVAFKGTHRSKYENGEGSGEGAKPSPASLVARGLTEKGGTPPSKLTALRH